MNIKQLQKEMGEYASIAQRFREHLHRHPELSFQEIKTAEFISSVLTGAGIDHRTGVGGYGVVAVLKGRKRGKTIALRADMDALPLSEENEAGYRSRNKGVMHACGHDFHVASLLTVLLYYAENPGYLCGTLIGVFQPAEEKSPGGAVAMLKDKLFGKMKPDAMLAIHAFPDLPAGKAGFRSGYYMASSDEVFITVKGKGGHGALVHKLSDPVLAAAHLLVATEQIASRMNKAGNPFVLSFGKLIANGALNIIPDQVEIAGTCRTMDEKWRKTVHKRLGEICRGISLSFNVKAELNIVPGYPSLFNHPDITRKSHEYAVEYLGKNNAVELEEIRMTAEDFAWFAREYPCTMLRVGTGFTDGRETFPLHSSRFDIDEKAYSVSVGLLIYMTSQFLSGRV
jgi:amidohydrolase